MQLKNILWAIVNPNPEFRIGLVAEMMSSDITDD